MNLEARLVLSPGSLAGISWSQKTIARDYSNPVGSDLTLPAGLAGDVESEAEGSAVINLPSGHGITEADKVGVFWAAGRRVDLTVTAHTTTTITVTMATGAGDAFPADETVLVVSVQTLEDSVSFDGADLEMLLVGCDQDLVARFVDAQGATVGELIEVAAGEMYAWASDTGPENPLDGAVAAAHYYNGGTAAARLQMGAALT